MPRGHNKALKPQKKITLGSCRNKIFIVGVAVGVGAGARAGAGPKKRLRLHPKTPNHMQLKGLLLIIGTLL